MSSKTYSNPLFDLVKEIIYSEFNPIHNEDLDSTPKKDRFDIESYLLESLLNRDTLMASSPKMDSLLDEFSDELILFKSIPPRIDEADCYPEEEICLIEKLLDEIDLTLTPDDSMPPGIEDDDYDSEGDILILEELISNDSLLLHENESFHFDIPSSPRPLAKPPDDDEVKPNLGILTVKVVGDISEHYVPMPTQPTHDSN
nr:hypothetical protein [Tanacetum cinerariifolium]